MVTERAEAVMRLVTLLFTDLESHSSLWESDPEAMSEALARHDAELRRLIETCGGVLVKHTGDGVMAAFDDPEGAVDAATGVVAVLDSGDWPVPLRARIGLHTGMAEHRGDDWFGPVAITSARLCAAAHGGQVLGSASIAAVTPTRPWVDLGAHRLGGLDVAVGICQLEVGAPRQFPPLRGVVPESAALPTPRNSFIGREQVVRDLVGQLDANRLVTITGPGGSGKTRLAIEVARTFHDGRRVAERFVDLSSADEEHSVVAQLAVVLHLEPDVDEAALLDRVMAVLAQTPTLMVLDNCEHLIDSAASVVDAILDGVPTCHVLATSREPLGSDGELVCRIGGLAPEESERLFTERAGALGRTGDSSVIARICARLDHLPLAIELAAARTDQLAPSELDRLLDHRFRLLTGRGRRPSRQRTLEATLDWSYRLLDDDERAALRHLAVFAGPFTLRRAADLLGLEEIDAFELVARLTDKSLLVSFGDRWGMLETVADYASHRLVDAGEADEWRVRHRDLWLEAVTAPPLDQVMLPSTISAELAVDWADLRSAVRWSMAGGDWTAAAQLVVALPGVMAMSRTSEGSTWPMEVAGHLEPTSDEWFEVQSAALVYLVFTLHLRDIALDAVDRRRADDRSSFLRSLGARAEAGTGTRDAFDLVVCSMMAGGHAMFSGDAELTALAQRWATLGRDSLLAIDQPSLFRSYGLTMLAEREMFLGDMREVLALAEAAVRTPGGLDVALLWAVLAVARCVAGDPGAADAARRSTGGPAPMLTPLLSGLVLAIEAARRADRASSSEQLRELVTRSVAVAENWSWLAVLAGIGVALQLGELERAARWLGGMRPSRMASMIAEVFLLRATFGSDPRLAGVLRSTARIERTALMSEVGAFADELGAPSG